VTTTPLDQLETPALLLDEACMRANIARMAARAAALGVALRPHVKTAKSLPAVLAMTGGHPGPVTVSTLREADALAPHGYTDITYAVGIVPNKFGHVARLLGQGVALRVILDSLDAARALRAAADTLPAPLGVLIEIDTDGHRAGLAPDAPALLTVAAALGGHPRLRLDGVLTHHGASYAGRDPDRLRAAAETERAGAVAAATRLRQAGHAAPVVSVGSTPTALFAEHLQGVTEMRPGVYVFNDLMMAGVGVCGLEDIATSVLTAVVGQRPERGWTLVDAGWMALSRDRGLAGSATEDTGYGLVADAAGRLLDGCIVSAANQEHGIVTHRSGDPARGLNLPVGTLLRILPNHACATAAQHAAYRVIDASGQVVDTWPRFNGW